jgi:hypothetical protein
LNVFFLYISVVGFRRDIRRLILIFYAKLSNRVAPLNNNREEHSNTINTAYERGKNRVN